MHDWTIFSSYIAAGSTTLTAFALGLPLFESSIIGCGAYATVDHLLDRQDDKEARENLRPADARAQNLPRR